MIRVFLREASLTLLGIVAASAVGFALLDRIDRIDWYDTARFAGPLQMPRSVLSVDELPTLWNRDVTDAARHANLCLDRLQRSPSDPAARMELLGIGSAALPTVLARVRSMAPDARVAVYAVLARWSHDLTGGDRAPVPRDPSDEEPARVWWERFDDARRLDFRSGYATRQALRLAAYPSRNAQERVLRLGTFSLPSIFAALESAPSDEGRRRLIELLPELTGVPHRLPTRADTATLAEHQRAWEAFWFSQRLRYETLPAWSLSLGHVLETRYGRWLTRAARGSLGTSVSTRRPVLLELRWRLPVSAFASGLGGLVGTAAVIGFGGNTALRRRRLKAKLLDFVGALVPGMIALIVGGVGLLRLCAGSEGSTALSREILREVGVGRLLVAACGVGVFAAGWLSRPRAASTLDLVRAEAEEWIEERRRPNARRIAVHGARIGVASLLCPLGLAAPVVLLGSLVVERAFSVPGMGALTLRALPRLDGPWLLVAILTVVPLLLGRRWALAILFAALASEHPRPKPRRATEPPPPMPSSLASDQSG